MAAALLTLSFATAPLLASTPDNLPAGHKPQAALPFGVFGSLEFATNAEAGTNQWQQVQKRMSEEKSLYQSCDEGKSSCPSYLATWRNNLREWKKQDVDLQLELVNGWVNRQIHYTDDSVIYDTADYWATPAESLKGRGDCEDYAIAKYASLKALGYTEDQLRIVIVNDTRKSVDHAVLSVNTADGLFILDNQNAMPVRHQNISYYQPLYSLNANGHWLNIATRQIKSQYNNAVMAEKDPAQTPKPAAVETVAAGQAQLALNLHPSLAQKDFAEDYFKSAPSLGDRVEDRR